MTDAEPEAVRDRAQQAAYRRAVRQQPDPPPWVVKQRMMQRSRDRALIRLREAHRDEYERYLVEEMHR